VPPVWSDDKVGSRSNAKWIGLPLTTRINCVGWILLGPAPHWLHFTVRKVLFGTHPHHQEQIPATTLIRYFVSVPSPPFSPLLWFYSSSDSQSPPPQLVPPEPGCRRFGIRPPPLGRTGFARRTISSCPTDISSPKCSPFPPQLYYSPPLFPTILRINLEFAHKSECSISTVTKVGTTLAKSGGIKYLPQSPV